MPHSLSKMSRRLHHLHNHGETSDHTLIQLTKRFQEETTITPKSSADQRRLGSAGLSYTCAFNPDVRKKADRATHRTNCLTTIAIPVASKTKHSAEKQRHEFQECCASREPPDVLSKQSQSSESGASSSWIPSSTNLETVTVTDVTMNFLTVTIKESSTDEGFFREKR